jgi:hypothetical protein
VDLEIVYESECIGHVRLSDSYFMNRSKVMVAGIWDVSENKSSHTGFEAEKFLGNFISGRILLICEV